MESDQWMITSMMRSRIENERGKNKEEDNVLTFNNGKELKKGLEKMMKELK